MFVCPYADHDEEQAPVECTPPREKGSTARILVPDSDNDDSLGLPISKESPSGISTPAARTFSKRAARCAAALLLRHNTAASVVQKQKCMQQLGRLGGAYRSLAHGRPFTVWVRCHDLNARVIRETEAFFEGRMADRLAHPYVTRKNGILEAAPKVVFDVPSQRRSPAASLGCRAPLSSYTFPTQAARSTSNSSSPVDVGESPPQAGYILSRGEQCALSLLFMEDTAGVKYMPSPLPAFAEHCTSDDDSQRMGLSESLCDRLSPEDCLAKAHATMPLWMYSAATDSLHSSPSPAAHQGDSSSAAQRHFKRGRGDTHEPGPQRLKGRRGKVCTARELVFDDPSASSSLQKAACREDDTAARWGVSTPPSLSATVIELQNQRVQWDVLRQQSLFSPV